MSRLGSSVMPSGGEPYSGGYHGVLEYPRYHQSSLNDVVLLSDRADQSELAAKKRFRALVEEHEPIFVAAPNFCKPIVVRDVLNKWQKRPGRFVDETGRVVGDDEAAAWIRDLFDSMSSQVRWMDVEAAISERTKVAKKYVTLRTCFVSWYGSPSWHSRPPR
jgi:hypothetical protein